MMRACFPMRNTFTFASGVRISSDFEAGNLWKCSEMSDQDRSDVGSEEEDEPGVEESKGQNTTTYSVVEEVQGGTESEPETKYVTSESPTLFAASDDELFCFDIWVCPDSLPYTENVK